MRRANTALLLLVLASPLLLIWAHPPEPPALAAQPLPAVSPEAIQQFDDLEREYDQAVAALEEQPPPEDEADADGEHPGQARRLLDKKFFLRFLELAEAYDGTMLGDHIRAYALRRWNG